MGLGRVMNGEQAGTRAINLFEGHHKGLRVLICALQDSLVSSRSEGIAVSAGLLRDLRAYAEQHFAEEEKLMDDVAFPLRPLHVEAHRHFLRWVATLESQAQAIPSGLIPETVSEDLAIWWEEHFFHYDRLLADFLCRGGV